MSDSYLIQRIFLWVIHVERVAAFVLLSIGAGSLAVRVMVLRLTTPVESAPGWLRGTRGLMIFTVTSVAACVAAFMAVRPDAFFMTQMGRDAVARKDGTAVITYYEPLVRWGLGGPDVARSLALAYFEKHRLRDGIAVLHRVLAVSPSLDDHTMCGRAHLILGEMAQARAHVKEGSALVTGPEGQAAVDWLAKAIEQFVPSSVPDAAAASPDPKAARAPQPR